MVGCDETEREGETERERERTNTFQAVAKHAAGDTIKDVAAADAGVVDDDLGRAVATCAPDDA